MRLREWLAVICGLAVAAGAWYGLRRLGPPPQPTVQVVVAARELPAYVPIQAEDLRLQTIPAAAADQRWATKPGNVVGQVLRVPVLAGEPVYLEKLAGPDEVLGPGYRAVAIPTSLVSAVGGRIQPGAKVDLHWVPSGPGSSAEAGGVLARNVLVLDVRTADNRSYRSPDGQGFGLTIGLGGQQLTAGASPVPGVLVLRLAPAQVQPVLTAAARGQVVVALHPTGGDVVAGVEGLASGSEPHQMNVGAERGAEANIPPPSTETPTAGAGAGSGVAGTVEPASSAGSRQVGEEVNADAGFGPTPGLGSHAEGIGGSAGTGNGN